MQVPGGTDKQIQYNDNGTLAGVDNSVVEKSTGAFIVGPAGGNQIIVQPGDQGAALLSGPSRFNAALVWNQGIELSAGEPGSQMFVAGSEGIEFFLYESGSMKHFGSGDNVTMEITLDDKLAFFGSAPVVKPVVTGNKNSDLKLVVTSLLTALSALGLITDSTT
jgi:hypothetical protein